MTHQLIKNTSFGYITSLAPSTFSYFLPVLYSLFSTCITCLCPSMYRPAKHVFIMSIIGGIKGVTIDYQKATNHTAPDTNEIKESYPLYAANGAIKSAIKFGVRALCSATIEQLGVNEYISKPLCTSAGGFASHLYSNGFKDIANNALTSILTIPSNVLSDIARKFLEPKIDISDQSYSNLNLYGIASLELAFFPSNLVHSLIIDFGKTSVKSLLEYSYTYINNGELGIPNPDVNASNSLIMNICQADKAEDLACYIDVERSSQQDQIDMNLFE